MNIGDWFGGGGLTITSWWRCSGSRPTRLMRSLLSATNPWRCSSSRSFSAIVSCTRLAAFCVSSTEKNEERGVTVPLPFIVAEVGVQNAPFDGSLTFQRNEDDDGFELVWFTNEKKANQFLTFIYSKWKLKFLLVFHSNCFFYTKKTK